MRRLRMSPDSIPQISLGTAALVIFVACAVYVALRGMTRVILGTLVIAASAWLGFLAWQQAPTLSVGWFGKPVSAVTSGLPLAVFLIAFFLIRMLAKSLARPFGKPDEPAEKTGSPVIRLAFRLLLALIPTSIIWLVGATFIHHTGSIAELSAFAEKNLGIDEPTAAKFTKRLKSSIDDALPESWLKTLDPLADPSRLTLAKLITAQSEAPYKPVIDPRTGKPIPRAIVVNDPELQDIAREGRFSTLLRHPLLTKALEDPHLQSLLKDLHL